MGQKVHPTGFRLGIATDWTSKWYANSNQFADFLDEDLKIREFLEEEIDPGRSKSDSDFTTSQIGFGNYSLRSPRYHYR